MAAPTADPCSSSGASSTAWPTGRSRWRCAAVFPSAAAALADLPDHLDLIAANPGIRAPDLAERIGLDTPTFERQVRRLKELGLTRSLRVGYRLSPRGAAFLRLRG